MKRFVLIIGVLAIFILYSIGIRHNIPVLKKPASLTTPLTATSTTTPTTSSTTSSNSSSATTSSTAQTNTTSSSSYKDGTYSGSVEDAYYGNVQVAAVISGAKITDVKVLQFPNTHSTSVIINQQALPYLKQEAIQAQSANIQLISGATYTSQAYAQSLANALSQAKV